MHYEALITIFDAGGTVRQYKYTGTRTAITGDINQVLSDNSGFKNIQIVIREIGS